MGSGLGRMARDEEWMCAVIVIYEDIFGVSAGDDNGQNDCFDGLNKVWGTQAAEWSGNLLHICANVCTLEQVVLMRLLFPLGSIKDAKRKMEMFRRTFQWNQPLKWARNKSFKAALTQKKNLRKRNEQKCQFVNKKKPQNLINKKNLNFYCSDCVETNERSLYKKKQEQKWTKH